MVFKMAFGLYLSVIAGLAFQAGQATGIWWPSYLTGTILVLYCVWFVLSK